MGSPARYPVMKVYELILELMGMPPDAEVGHIWDGAMRTHINVVYLANSGEVATADWGQTVHDLEDRPLKAPHTGYWETPSDEA